MVHIGRRYFGVVARQDSGRQLDQLGNSTELYQHGQVETDQRLLPVHRGHVGGQ